MHTQQLSAIRRFNRTLTQRVGALNDSFLGRGRPLGQARLLYEIGMEGADLSALRTRLALDSGYLSRLLRALERERLIQAAPSQNDARRRTVALSRKGRRELEEYNRQSDAHAKSVLEALTAEQRDRLVAAMGEVERLLIVSAVRIEIEPADSADAKWCLQQYYAELARRFDSGFDPGLSISASTAELTPPAGYFVVARTPAQPVGCGALKIKVGGVGEIKRMWVDASTRGLGVGQRVLQLLEETARGQGVRLLRLETNQTLKEAQALYRRNGYREVRAFNDEPYAHHWFEKTLLPVPASSRSRKSRMPARRAASTSARSTRSGSRS
jgi:DNA-binding MarR family transcriptional regulator/N-acetylglutamate synthase-like GNAT family acetyltransferase